MSLILGTAEFDPQGYADNGVIDDSEKRKILACAKEGGINMIDTAEGYNCHDYLKKEAKGFSIYTKTRDWKVNLDWGNNELRGLLYHYKQEEAPVELPFIHRWLNLGVSVYSEAQIPENRLRILQIPFSLSNRKFEGVFDAFRTVFVRSIFNRGELLRRYSVKDCLDFVKQYRPCGIIVGVKTALELEEILKWHG